MAPPSEYRRLSRLLDESINPFSDLGADSWNEEVETNLLIALSQVLRQVKQWIHEFDSDEDLLSSSPDDREHLVATASDSDNHRCLVKIIGDLMFLLVFDSRYTRHLVGNMLVAISELVLALDADWDDFVHLLCFCLELSVYNSLPSSSESGAPETRCSNCIPSASKSILKLKLKSADWSVVAAIFRVLHNMQKNLKQDFDEKLMKAYLNSVSSVMLNLPWDMLIKLHIGDNVQAPTMFFGSFIQFLCSLIGQCSFLEDDVDISSILTKIINLVPELTAWCHSKLQSPLHARISHYFRHKLLMLMVKLSSSIQIKPTVLITWIHLVKKYFGDLLLQPISRVEFDKDSFFEDSPFCTSISDPRKQSILSCHLQRLTVFLFLKCSLNLVGVEERVKDYGTADVDLDSECSGISIGMEELHKWLQAHGPADILVNDELYFGQCVRFTVLFLQLFMHEDDILFEMLLLLFRIPFYPERRIVKDQPLEKVNCRLASDLFNPIHMFHLFLAEIHYDHQVLLDYLISKDTGSTCAEYLLRSLRIVCNSWSSFVEFQGVEEGLDQFCTNRQNDSPFIASMDCLVSLRKSINNLNKKKLFPYNPQVLLRRLMTFEELCVGQ